VRFLFDENLSPLHAAHLRGRGYDATAVVHAGLSGADDTVVRSFAIQEHRVLVTLDADFGNILRFPAAGTPGVIWLRLHPPTEAKIGLALSRCLAALTAENLAGKLAVVDEDKIRIRG
jgi:predicted nuclease of predicted toxin-antitoxin system